MHTGIQIRRALSVTTALTVATLGAISTAQAGSGHDHGHHGQAGSHGRGAGGAESHGKGHTSSHASGHANGHAHAHGQSHGHGPSNGHGHGQLSAPQGHAAGGAPAHGNGHGNASSPAAPEPTSHAAAGGGLRGGGDPAGNNGTVKITPPGEDDGTPQNHPHQGCVFDIEWYGFDEGDDIVSTVTFADHAPTADAGLTGVDGDPQVFVGGDPASGAGTGSGFDGEESYRLAFAGDPHPKQGYHVKLTVHTPGSLGSDTKHKVYWVEGCEETTTPPGEEETPPAVASPPEVAGTEATAPRGPEVLGEQQTAPSGLPTAVNAGVATVKWATSPAPLLVALLGVLLAGLGYLARRRRAS